MLTASKRFSDALKDSHQALTKVTLLKPDTTSGFVHAGEYTVTAGTLSIDCTRNVWRSADMSLAAETDADRSALRAIDGTDRLKIERGIRYYDGSEEWVQIALMQVQESDVDQSNTVAQVSAQDLGALVEGYDLITPYAPIDTSQNKMTTIDAIKDLVQAAVVWDAIPAWHIDPALDATVMPVDGTVFSGGRWSAIQTLAESIGAVCYAGVDGSWYIQSARTKTSAAMKIESGKGGTLVNYALNRSRADQYNAVPLRWAGPTIGGLVFMVDSDPASPTFWNGPFGRHSRAEESNDVIETEAQAIEAAQALLDQYKGRASKLSFTAVHNPLLEPMDTVHVTVAGGLQVHVIDSISYPLAGGIMSCQTRQVQSTQGGYDDKNTLYDDAKFEYEGAKV
ncbi:MAG: DUF5047 domain-containing protein [Ilumatobacteraceae bacterium]